MTSASKTPQNSDFSTTHAISSMGAVGFRPPAPIPHERPLGLIATVATIRRNPMELWTRRHYETPVVLTRTILGTQAMVSDPAAVRRIFLDNVSNYRKDTLQLRVLKPALGNGLLTAEGDDWKTQRRALASLFTPRQVAAFSKAMQDSTQAGVARMRNLPNGHRIDLSEEMARLTLEILEHTLFSQGLGRNTDDFQQAVNQYFETAGRPDPLDVLGFPDFIPRLGRRRARATLGWFQQAVQDIIDARLKLIASGAEPERDILTLLLQAQDPETGLGLSEEDVRSNIITFIGAGHETTANALTWTLYLLSQSPEWRERVEAEVAEQLRGGPIETLAERMPIVKAVLEESMRLYPPAAYLSRQAIAEDELGGQKIPAGALCVISPFVLHRHRTLWDDPGLFNPTRFLGENREKIDRFAFLPFGAGPRICIGMGFAMQEMVIALSHLVEAFRFDHAPDHEIKAVQRITLRPQGGMPMFLQLR